MLRQGLCMLGVSSSCQHHKTMDHSGLPRSMCIHQACWCSPAKGTSLARVALMPRQRELTRCRPVPYTAGTCGGWWQAGTYEFICCANVGRAAQTAKSRLRLSWLSHCAAGCWARVSIFKVHGGKAMPLLLPCSHSRDTCREWHLCFSSQAQPFLTLVTGTCF